MKHLSTGLDTSHNQRWPSVQLGALLTRIDAGKCVSCVERPAAASEWGVLKVSAVTWGEFRPSENKVLPENFTVPDGAEVCVGDFLISRSNTTELVGAVALVRETRPKLMLSDKTLRIVPRPDYVSGDYLEFALRTKPCREFIERNATGSSSSMKNITQVTIRQIPVPLPPLAEQRRIAGRLREQLAEVAHARTAVQAQLSTAQVLPAAFRRSAFLLDEGKPWETKPLAEVANISGGMQKTPERAPVNFHRPFLTVRNVQRGFLDLSKVERFEVTPAEFERLRLCRGDILIVEGNGSVDHIGRNAVFNEEGEWIHQNHIIRVRLRPKVLPEFVSQFLNSDAGTAQLLEKAKSTTGLYTLSTAKVSSLEVPVPAIEVQRAIATRLSAELAEATQLQKSLTDKLAAIDRLPITLLAQAFHGNRSN